MAPCRSPRVKTLFEFVMFGAHNTLHPDVGDSKTSTARLDRLPRGSRVPSFPRAPQTVNRRQTQLVLLSVVDRSLSCRPLMPMSECAGISTTFLRQDVQDAHRVGRRASRGHRRGLRCCAWTWVMSLSRMGGGLTRGWAVTRRVRWCSSSTDCQVPARPPSTRTRPPVSAGFGFCRSAAQASAGRPHRPPVWRVVDVTPSRWPMPLAPRSSPCLESPPAPRSRPPRPR